MPWRRVRDRPHPTGSCSGWGGSHYTTFDGTTYSFADNCTHVLMKEIRPRYGNLSISMNGYYCGAAAAPAPCPRALSVHYKSMEVILTTRTGARGQEQSLVSGPGPASPGRACGRRGQLPGAPQAGPRARRMPRGPQRGRLGPQAPRGASALRGRGAKDSGLQHPSQIPQHVPRSCSTKCKWARASARTA